MLMIVAVYLLWFRDSGPEVAQKKSPPKVAAQATDPPSSVDPPAPESSPTPVDTKDQHAESPPATETVSVEKEAEPDPSTVAAASEPKEPPSVPFGVEQNLPTEAEVAFPATRAEQLAQSCLPALRELEVRLDTGTRQPKELVETARWCVGKGLDLEAEQCLRSALAVVPDDEEAKELYAQLSESKTVLDVPDLTIQSRLDRLPDGDLMLQAPKGRKLVLIKVAIAPGPQKLRFDEKSLKALVDGGQAEFLGFYQAAPPTQIQGLARNQKPPEKPNQLWEVLEVAKVGENAIARFQNTKAPIGVTKSSKGKAPLKKPHQSRTSAYRTVKDSSYFEAKNPQNYMVAFEVGESETTVQIQYGDEPAVVAMDRDLRRSLNIIPVEELTGYRKSQVDLEENLNRILEDPRANREVYLISRTLRRSLYRMMDHVGPQFLPETPPQESHLIDLKYELRPPGGDQTVRHPRGSRISETIITSPQVWRIRASVTVRLRSVGHYYACITGIGPEPEYQCLGHLPARFQATEPGLYTWGITSGWRDGTEPKHYVVEFWMGERLTERRIIAQTGKDLAQIRRRQSSLGRPRDYDPKAWKRVQEVHLTHWTPTSQPSDRRKDSQSDGPK